MDLYVGGKPPETRKARGMDLFSLDDAKAQKLEERAEPILIGKQVKGIGIANGFFSMLFGNVGYANTRAYNSLVRSIKKRRKDTDFGIIRSEMYGSEMALDGEPTPTVCVEVNFYKWKPSNVE